jgi:RHS repeat-associated protein
MFAATSGYRSDGDAGLTHVGARYYDAQVGRFITRDTVLSEHPYVYCNADPVNAVDPTGHLSLTFRDYWNAFWGGVGAFIGGTVTATPTAGAGTVGGVVGGGLVGLFIGDVLWDWLSTPPVPPDPPLPPGYVPPPPIRTVNDGGPPPPGYF